MVSAVVIVIKYGVVVGRCRLRTLTKIDNYIEGWQMNRLAYLVFAICITIVGCSKDDASVTEEEITGTDTPVEAAVDEVSAEVMVEAVEEAAEGVAEEIVEEEAPPVEAAADEIGVGSSI